jgi:hypothetical protein
VTKNKPALILGLIAAGLLGLVIALLIQDDNGSSNSQQKPSVVTVNQPPPKPRKTGGELKTSFAAETADTSNDSFYVEGTMEGSTLEWNGQAGNYIPTESFRRPAVLIVDPDSNFGVFSGSVAEETAGTLWFVTNSYVLRHMRGVAAFAYFARLPAASVTARSNSLEAVVGPGARAVQLNSFQVKTGLSSPKQIVEGRVEITASGQSVRGEIELYGGGYIEPGNSFPVDLIRATFSN